MNRYPAVGLLSLLSLAISLAVFTPLTFGQFEEVPDEQSKKIDEVQDPNSDAFGASPDEFDAGEMKNSGTDPNTLSDSKPVDVTTDESTPSETDETPSRDKTAVSDKSEKTAPATKATTSQSAADKPFEELFWQYLKANNYSNWAPAPGSSGDLYRGESPHGDLLKLYMNRMAAGKPEDLPIGSVIIKENYDSEKVLLGITVMYRADGYNPKSGNWYWVKYDPDGTVARTSTDTGFKKIRGAVASCIECHSDAGGGDFVFFND